MKKKIALIVLILGIVILISALFISNNSKEYVVTFITNDGSSVASQSIKKGKFISKPTNPTKDGYEFIGWYLNDLEFDFTTEITEDMTLTAKWKKIEDEDEDDKKIVVKFNSSGGSSVREQEPDEDLKIEKPEDPIREGYKFIGWYLDDLEFDFESEITKTITLNAKWEKIYKVTFDTDGGSKITQKEVEDGKTVSKPLNPTKKGYTFKEWQLNGKTYNFSTKVVEDITLKAIWEKAITYTVSFDSDGGSKVVSQEIEKNKTAVKPTNPTKSGYVFKGWILNDKDYDFSLAITKNITLKAKWKKVYTVTFDLNGGSSNINNLTIEDGMKVTKPTDPTRSGYSFTGWTLNGSTYNFNNVVNNNIKLIANWKALNYTVTFNSSGGTSINSQTLSYKGKVTKPTNPTKSGYVFKEWQLNGKTFDFTTEITSNIELNAVWTKNVYVVQTKEVDNFTTEYELVVTENGNVITVKEIKRKSDGKSLCSGIMYINKSDVKNVDTFIVVLEDGTEVEATKAS